MADSEPRRVAYTPAEFQCNELAEQQRLIRANPLGILLAAVSTSSSSGSSTATAGTTVSGSSASGQQAASCEVFASHIPFVLLEGPAGSPGKLLCHVARANSLWQDLARAGEATAIFSGPHHYISPAWCTRPTRPHSYGHR